MSLIFQLVQPLGNATATWTPGAYIAPANPSKVMICGGEISAFPIAAGVTIDITVGTGGGASTFTSTMTGAEATAADVRDQINADAIAFGPGVPVAAVGVFGSNIVLFDPTGSAPQHVSVVYTGAPFVDWGYLQIPEVSRTEGVATAYIDADAAPCVSLISDPVPIPVGANSVVLSLYLLGRDPDPLLAAIRAGIVLDNALGVGDPGLALTLDEAQLRLLPLPLAPLYDGAPNPSVDFYGTTFPPEVWFGRLIRSAFKLPEVTGLAGPASPFVAFRCDVPFGLPPGYTQLRVLGGPETESSSTPGLIGARLPPRLTAGLQFGVTP